MAKVAAAGLSIVFVGTPPDQDLTYGSGAAGNEQVRQLIQQRSRGGKSGAVRAEAVMKYNKTSTRTDPSGPRGPVQVEPFSVATVYSP